MRREHEKREVKKTLDVFAIAIQKGGTGKTTTAVALAQAAAYRGDKALLIDLDPQGNASFATGADTRGGGSFELLEGTPAAEIVQHISPELDVIPASRNLATVTSGRGSARRLQQAVRPLKREYDIIIIDTPPTAGELQYNALQAATQVIFPLQADSYNIQAFYQITDTARQIQESNPELEIRGILLTQYDQRSTITRQMRQAILNTAGELNVPYLGEIRAAVAVKEAAALQRSLFDYAPRSNPAQDYLYIYDRIAGVFSYPRRI